MWAHYASNHKGICLSFKADCSEGNLEMVNKNYLELGHNVNFYICKWIKGKYGNN